MVQYLVSKLSELYPFMKLDDLSEVEQANLLLKQAYALRINNIHKSIALADQALTISTSIKNNSLCGKSLNQLSLYHMITSDFEKSNAYSNRAIKYFESINDDIGIAGAKYNIGSVLYKSYDYHNGLVYLLEALVIYKKHEDIANLSKVEKAVGTIYEYIGDPDNAFKTYKSAIKNARKIDNINLESNVLNNLSGLVLKKGKSGMAMKMITHSINLKLKSGDRRGYGFAIYGRAKVYIQARDFKKAETDLNEALSIHKEFKEQMGSSMALSKLGKLYLEMGDLNQAEEKLQESLKLTLKYNISMIKIKNYHLLYLTNKSANKTIEALLFLEHYLKEKEITMTTQTLRVIDNYELINKMSALESETSIQKEKQKAIDKKNRDKKKTLKQKQDFLSIMSHEIRTPLNAITTIVSLLKDRIQGEDRKLFGSLQFASNNLITIVNEILDFTKLDSNKSVIEYSNVNFDALCSNIINLYVNAAKHKNIDLILDNRILKKQYYLIDQPKMAQILGNLISNAIKFTTTGSIVFLTELVDKDKTHDKIRFSVKDSGEGISKKNINIIFDSFSQIKPITTRVQGGTGLGLAIVKKLVLLYGGIIQVNSTLNKGSEFYFTIKLKRIEKKEIIEINNFEALKNKKVLIAEDTLLNAVLIQKVLSKWNIKSHHVKDGKEALEAAKKNRFDFILMDVHMPIMNGLEATRLIKTTPNKNKNTPVFAVTADVLTNNDKKNSKLFEAILWKPLEIDKLFLALSGKK